MATSFCKYGPFYDVLDENFSGNDPFLFQASNIPDFNKSKLKKVNNDCVTVRLHNVVVGSHKWTRDARKPVFRVSDQD